MNLIVLIFEESKKVLTAILLKYGSNNIEPLVSHNLPYLYIFPMMEIYLILIRKQLTSSNYAGWIASKIRTFTQYCGTYSMNFVLVRLQLSSQNCAMIYGIVTSRWEVRRTIFKFIKASSSSKETIYIVARASMVLLNGAELGTFNLTNRCIVIENSILLYWAELAKYSVHLVAAIDKYQKLGDDALCCKLLYPSHQLPEFNRKGLRIFATIARKIAILEGQDTLKNYAGTLTELYSWSRQQEVQTH